MRFTMPFLAAAVAAALMFESPKPLYGQSNELKAISAVQRDIFELQRKVEEVKASQGTKSDELQTLVKQLMEANTKLSSDLRNVQDKLLTNQAEQQKNVIGPLSDLKRAVEDLSGNITGLQTGQNTQGKQLATTATKVEDLTKAINAILDQLDKLKAPAPVTLTITPEQAAQQAYAAADLDWLANKPEFALPGFADVAKTYATSPYAPAAWFKVGTIYVELERYEDALEAFDRVLERFGDNPMRGPARMRKAEALEKLNRKDDAIREYEIVVKEGSADMAATAKARILELKPPPTAAPPKNNKAKTPAKNTKKK